MTCAIDYSFVRFTGAELKAAGVTAVGRYLGPAGTPKAVTKAELDTLRSAGIVVWFVFEVAADDAAGGSNAGTAHATQIDAYLSALGLPMSQPVYVAVDESVTPATAVPYFQGVNAVRPGEDTGVYGEGALCGLLHSAGLAAWFWQSASTSFPGNATTLDITDIQQSATGAPLSTTDLDVLRFADVGQFPRPFPPAPPPAPYSGPQIVKPLTGKVGNMNAPVVAICRTPSGQGYTLVGADGGTFDYGDAKFLGSLATTKLNAPIVDAAMTSTGDGLVMVGTDGGVFCFGDAPFDGSEGGKTLNAPVVTIALTPDDKGYWLTAADGGVFAFGDAPFKGSPA